MNPHVLYRKQIEKNYEAPCSNRSNVDSSKWGKKKNKFMRLVYNSTWIKLKKITEHNSWNNIILKDEFEKKIN
jgi:hypothetical protein